MDECTAEEGLRLLDIAGISLPEEEVELFKSEFKKIYSPSEECYNFLDSVWKVYSEILPFKAHPDNGENMNYLIKIKRDNTFQDKVVKSGLSEKLKSGISIKELSK
jgi:hypothetical protein